MWDSAPTASSPALLPLQVFSFVYQTTAAGPDAKGELVVFIDGKNVGGRIAPVEVGSSRRRYDWTNEIAVRPGKHRLLIGGLEKGSASTRNSNTYYTDFTIAEEETKAIFFSPSEDKTSWSISVESEAETPRK
jgi:hypothetical protein